MATEIEAKYLLRQDGVDYATPYFFDVSRLRNMDEVVREATLEGSRIRQGYLPKDKAEEVKRRLNIFSPVNFSEARLREYDNSVFFAIKEEERKRTEQKIPYSIFNLFWFHTRNERVNKIRLNRSFISGTVERTMKIDVYTDNRDLIVAEVEVPTFEEFLALIPLGKDVTKDPKFKNRNLAK